MTPAMAGKGEPTPGPWRWNPEEPLILESATAVEHEYGEMGSVLSSYPQAVLICTEQPAEADAALIARSPDMSAALERIEEMAEGWRVGGPGINPMAEAAKTLRAIRDEAREARGEAGS